MKTPLSPSDIEVLIWSYCCCEAHPREDATAITESIKMFQDAGMVKTERERDGVYRTTAKGDAMVQSICRTQEPRSVWVDSDGNILEENW